MANRDLPLAPDCAGFSKDLQTNDSMEVRIIVAS
jgi:hypothetical protein